MRHRYLVVDQNYLRTRALQDILVANPEVRLVLPDLAMLEMTKPVQRELTVRLSLKDIAREPGRVFVSKATSECLKYELTFKRSVSGHMLFREATNFVRKILIAVDTGVPNEQHTKVIEDPENHIPELMRDYLDHETNKARSLELVDATKQEMSAEFARRVRGAKVATEERIAFVAEKAPSLLVGVLEDTGFSREKAIAFARTRPMLLRYFYLKLWACLVWEEQGRLESLGALKVSNDLLDHEYVLAGTFFDGVLSAEPAVNEAYQAVKRMLSARV